MRRLVASGLLPERAGQPVKAWVHISLAELRAMDDGSVLQTQWITEMQIRWSAHCAETADGSAGDGGAWLGGDAARGAACDATLTPAVTGDIDPAALDDLVGPCACSWPAMGQTALQWPAPAPAPRPAACRQATCPPGPGTGPLEQLFRPVPRGAPSRPSSARSPTCCPGPAGWPASCGTRSSWAPGAGPPEPATGHRVQLDHPARHPQRGRPAGQEVPLARAAPTSPPPPARSTT